jgi:ABC-type multidrug transport system fused ATPase/permease subunit
MIQDSRARALPIWGEGKSQIPQEQLLRQQAAESDARGIADVLKIFIRTWPYLIPMVLGYWRTSSGVSADDGDSTTASSWNYNYVPFLVTGLALLGMLAGWVPLNLSWQHDILFWSVVAMVALSWSLIFARGRSFLIALVVLVVVAAVANLFAILAVTGWQDNLHIGLVTFGCLCMWLFQYQTVDGRLQVRVRLGCHLVYYYILVWVSTMMGVVAGLFTVDLLNQSILQAQPLTPFLANFVGQPELAAGAVESLDVVQRQDLQWTYITFVVAIGFITFPLGVGMPYYNVWIMQQINQSLRLALVERWHQLSLRYHSKHRVGDSVYRIYQDSAQVTAVISMLISVSTQVIQYTITIVFVAALDPILGILGVTIAILAIGYAAWFSPRVRSRSLVARQAGADLTSRIQEVLGAVQLIKANGMEAREQQRFEQDSINAFNAAFRVRSLVAVVGIIMFTMAAAILLGGEFLMAIWASDNRETFAAILIGLVGLSFVRWNLAAFQWAQAEFFKSSNQVRGVVRQWTSAQDMAMGLDRVFEILDIEPDVMNAPDAIPMPVFSEGVVFDHVGFAYESDRAILDDISLVVKPGTINAIVGPTGSGKSTLVGLLTRLYDPDSGSISIDGNDLRQIDVESLRWNVSIALQENVLFAMSVRDNIRYVVPDADDAAVYLAAEIACADDYIRGLPEGLDTVLGDRGGKLSTGQRQRLSIARALVKDSPILILDEPTAALDANTEHQVLSNLSAWCKGEAGGNAARNKRAIFLITHRISTIQKADQIVYLDQGRILERGTHAELMLVPDGHYRRFVETEAMLQAGTQSGGADDHE